MNVIIAMDMMNFFKREADALMHLEGKSESWHDNRLNMA